jgi:predicted nucleic acid-binding Zn ribbon protein
VFHKSKKKERILRIVWTIIGIIVIAGMMLLYFPVFQ